MKSRNTKLVSLFLIVALLLAFLPSASAANVELTAEQDAKAIIPVTDSFLTDSGCQIGRYIDTVAFKEKNHVSRLKADEDVNTYVFLNDDNTKTVYYMDEAVKFVDDDGYIREKNTDLTYHVTGFSTAQNDVGLEIPTLPSSGISLSYNDNQISLYPLNGYPLSAAIRNGNSVDYPYFYGLGTTLRVTPTNSGVMNNIVLSSYPGTNEFTFRLNTGGLTLYQSGNSWYLAQPGNTAEKFWLGRPEVFDAKLKIGTADMDIDSTGVTNEYTITITVTGNFLTNSSTTYPVTISPTVKVYSDNLNGVNSIEDAPIYSGYPDSNFGTYQYNRAGYVDSSYKVGRTLVRLNGLWNDTNFKTAAEISSVKFCIADASGSAPTLIKLHPMESNDTWTETNITWYTKGDYNTNSSVGAYLGNGQFSYFDIKNLVETWRNDETKFKYGFVLKAANESSGDRALYSAEHSTSSMRPYVVADYIYFMRSGGELAFDPDPWNTSSVQSKLNCYCYALNYMVEWRDPGNFAGIGLEIYDQNVATIHERLIDDSNSSNAPFTITHIPDSQKYTATKPGSYKILLVTAENNGYHFYRQDEDGSWSHKFGKGIAKNTDGHGNRIYNPETAFLFGYTNDPTFDFSYFFVTPNN